MSLWAALSTVPGIFLFAMAILGLLVGSFLNVVIHRLPLMLERQWRADCATLVAPDASAVAPRFDLLLPRSRCPRCEATIQARDNLPLISYLILGGRCRNCKTRIPLRYPAVELLSGVATVAVAGYFGFGWTAMWAAILTWSLLALGAIDFDTQLLPDAITLPVMWLGLLLNSQNVFVDLHSAVFGAAAGYLSLWSIYWLFKLATGKEGMGYGDFKLLGMLGAWLGWTVLPVVILMASVVGAVVGIGLITFSDHDRTRPIPFGPFLAAAGWIALLWGQPLSRLVLGAGSL